jgi:outer membrane lipoprotein
MKRILFIMLAASMLAGCGHVLSKEIRLASKDSAAFSEVRKAPDNFIGGQYIWGGFIASGKIEDTGTYLEIVQNPLDGSGHVIDPDVTEGRFIAFFPGQHLDPMIYEKGRILTLGGILTGTITGMIKDRGYLYPLMEVQDHHLWKKSMLIEPEHRYLLHNPYVWPRIGPEDPY